MKFIVAITAFFLSFGVSADHQGPMVLGKMRSEQVIFCLTNKSIDKMIAIHVEISKMSVINDRVSLELVRRMRALYGENRCSPTPSLVSYVPLKVLRQWDGKDMRWNTDRVTVYSLVESRMRAIDGEMVTAFIVSSVVPDGRI